MKKSFQCKSWPISGWSSLFKWRNEDKAKQCARHHVVNWLTLPLGCVSCSSRVMGVIISNDRSNPLAVPAKIHQMNSSRKNSSICVVCLPSSRWLSMWQQMSSHKSCLCSPSFINYTMVCYSDVHLCLYSRQFTFSCFTIKQNICLNSRHINSKNTQLCYNDVQHNVAMRPTCAHTGAHFASILCWWNLLYTVFVIADGQLCPSALRLFEGHC